MTKKISMSRLERKIIALGLTTLGFAVGDVIINACSAQEPISFPLSQYSSQIGEYATMISGGSLIAFVFHRIGRHYEINQKENK